MASYPRTLLVGSTRLACPAVCVPTQCGGVHNGMRDTSLALAGTDAAGDALGGEVEEADLFLFCFVVVGERDERKEDNE